MTIIVNKVNSGGISMKNKVQRLVSVFFALTMALSTGALLSKARVSKATEIVLAEDDVLTPEETPEETVAETPTEQPQEQSQSGGEQAPAEKPAETQPETTPVTPKNILMVFINAFKDAFKDLLRHIKSWFKRG